MKASHRRPRGRSFVCAFALSIAALLAFGSGAHAACQIDVDCADTPDCANDVPGQKDLTQFCTDSSDPILGDDLSWNWDDIAFSSGSSNNTEDGCALYDTDGDGNANYSVCVTVSTDGINPDLQFQATTVYSCSDNKPDRCTSPNAVFSSPGTSCSVTNPSPTDPFPTGTASPDDTRATCHIQTTEFVCDPDQTTPCDPTLLNVCSFPSQQPGSDPEDCILIPGVPPNLCDTLDCDDGLFCNGVETCDPTLNGGAGGCVPGTPPTCSNGQFCDGLETCDPTANNGVGACVNGTPPTCSNGQFCDGLEICDPTASGGAGACVNGTAPTCDNGQFCDGLETCDPTASGGAGACVNGTAPTCSNGQFCDGLETCDPTANGGAGSCVNGTAPTCSNGQFCDGLETCDPSANGGAGSCVNGTAPTCDNGVFCDGTETCDPTANGGAGGCVDGADPTCDDDIACTTDECSAALDRCVNTPDNSQCDDGIICTANICDPAEGCQNPFDPTQDPSCVLETCRTAGFWSTHGNLTGTLIGAAGCLSICGERIDDVKTPAGSFKGSADSALEAMCVPVEGDSTLQLARQLTAAALNCIVSSCVPGDVNGDCSNSSVATIFNECNTACADPATPKATITSCIAAIDCFNNGGIPDLAGGTCRTGSCSQTVGPCGTGFPPCPDGETCTLLATNCELQPLENTDCGIDFEPPGKANSKPCNDANKGACTVVGPGESQCSENTETGCTSQ